MSIIESNKDGEDLTSEVESNFGEHPEELLQSNEQEFNEDEGRLTLQTGKETSKSRRKKKEALRSSKTNKEGNGMCGKDEKACCVIF